jgi:hypothetical protein
MKAKVEAGTRSTHDIRYRRQNPALATTSITPPGPGEAERTSPWSCSKSLTLSYAGSIYM